MTGFPQEHPAENLFSELLDHLSRFWPKSSLSYVEDMVSHAEYGEAFENFAMLANRDGHPLDTEALRLAGEIGNVLQISPADLFGKAMTSAGQTTASRAF